MNSSKSILLASAVCILLVVNTLRTQLVVPDFAKLSFRPSPKTNTVSGSDGRNNNIEAGAAASNHRRGLLAPWNYADPTSVTAREDQGNTNHVQFDMFVFSPLPSGWDTSGFDLYEKTKNDLAVSLIEDPSAVHLHRVAPLETVKTTSNAEWWQHNLGNGKKAPIWEPETFTNFIRHLSGCRYYVGFGTWIGPTLFYAAQLVEEAYGIEADPVAFAKVEMNLALNKGSTWAMRVHLNHHAVGLGSDDQNSTPTNLGMATAGAGNSCSGLGKIACGTAKVFWKVNTYPLPYLLRRWNVPSTRELFIKVDVESFECQLVPSWLPWLEAIEGSRPTFHLALHEQIINCSEEEYSQLYQFGLLFDNKDDKCMDAVKEQWTCKTGEFVFYDRP